MAKLPRSNLFIHLFRYFLVFAVGATLALPPVQAARLALVVGNDNYEAIPKLRNAGADVDAMAKALRKAGFDVTDLKDRTLRQMKDDVRQFRDRVRGGDEVVLFFSGHGVQIDGMNYLLPVDVRSNSEGQVRDDALALSQVLEDLRQQRPALTLAIVDACRDNPFKGNGRSIGGRGLARVAGATGQMVIYSAGEGQQALDSLGARDPVRNGVFTRVFVKEMEQRGVTIDQVARNVREEVYRLAQNVKHEQVPAIYDQVLGRYYFYGPGPASNRPIAPGYASAPDMALTDDRKNVCKSLLRGQFDRWIVGRPAHFHGSFVYMDGRAASTQGPAAQLSQQLGLAVNKGHRDEPTQFNASYLKQHAGFVGYREDIFGTRQGAECVAELLGTGYRVGACSSAGFPYSAFPSASN
ncbi:MAG: caspase family protein [Pseudomonadota bacterium]